MEIDISLSIKTVNARLGSSFGGPVVEINRTLLTKPCSCLFVCLFVVRFLVYFSVAYADSDPLRWLSWFDLMEPLTRTLPMHVVRICSNCIQAVAC